MLSPIRSSGQPIDNHNTRFHRRRVSCQEPPPNKQGVLLNLPLAAWNR
jgi:hypothetical protein